MWEKESDKNDIKNDLKLVDAKEIKHWLLWILCATALY